MKNKQTIRIASITGVIILICALLPVIVLKTGDAISDGKIYTSDIQTIQFNQNLSSADILYVVARGMHVEMAPEKMNLKEADLDAVIAEKLLPYKEAGLVSYNFDEFNIRACWPYRGYSDDDSSVSGAFWVVDAESTNQSEQFMHLFIDDQSGDILLFNYMCTQTLYSSYDVEELINYHQNLMDTYSDLLGIELTFNHHEDSLYERNYRIYNVETNYGTVGLNISLTDFGFSITPALEDYSGNESDLESINGLE